MSQQDLVSALALSCSYSMYVSIRDATSSNILGRLVQCEQRKGGAGGSGLNTQLTRPFPPCGSELARKTSKAHGVLELCACSNHIYWACSNHTYWA